jgi:ATP-dependent exoDNAse (exonuclease V) beta subunit
VHSNFTIYNASAGSGKTYTITKEYLSILLKEPQPFRFQFILAVTFTNKAASEMKTRILNTLIGFAGLDSTKLDRNLLHTIAKQIDIEPDEIKNRSYSILKQLLNNYADFEVSTIDSFNHRIIRTFARDLRISQNFSIELDAKDLITKAVNQLIEDLGKDEALTTWLSDFVQLKIKDNTSGDIRSKLNEFAELALNENNYAFIKHLESIGFEDYKAAKSVLVDNEILIQKDLLQLREDFNTLLHENGVESKSFPRQTIPKNFDKAVDEKLKIPLDYDVDTVKEKSFYNKTAKQAQKDSIDRIRPEIEEHMLRLKDLYYDLQITRRVLKSLTPLAMISEILNKLKTIKEEEEILFVNDFNRLISNQVVKQPAPFIYERLGEKFRHYFIDEFQDTSRLQWQNFIPLAEHALSSVDLNSKGSSLFLVGDVKQSIYEWRGGDPEQLMDLYFKKTNPFTINPDNKELSDNWRSAKNIVDFNNTFFEFASKELTDKDHQNIYSNVHQNWKKDEEGYVEIQFLEDEKDKEILAEQRLEEIIRIIHKAKNDGYNLKDICILVRNNRFAVEIVEALNALEKPIPVVSQESLLIKSDFKAELLILFLNLVNDFSADLKAEFLLKWFNFKQIHPKEIHVAVHELITLEDRAFCDALIYYGIEFNLNDFNSLGLYSKAEYCLKCLGFERQMNAYLQFLLDEIFSFSNKTSQDLFAFLEHWNNNKDKLSISTSEASDAIKIMTIHKSKGLQFPIVIYAYANFNLSTINRSTKDWIFLDERKFGLPLFYENISNSIQYLNDEFSTVYDKNVKKTELANINTAYVSMTRPEEQLYVLVDPQIDKTNLDFRALLLQFLKTKGLYKSEQMRYEIGAISPKTKTESQFEEKPYHFNASYSKRFYKTLSSESHFDEEALKSKTYGIEIHKIFENIIYEEDFYKIKENLKYKDEVEQVLTNQEISMYFKPPWKIYNETDIAFNGEIIRLDRLCIHEDKAVIIDYKTGAETSKDILQLTNYKKAIEALGFKEIMGFLVYLRKNILVKSI